MESPRRFIHKLWKITMCNGKIHYKYTCNTYIYDTSKNHQPALYLKHQPFRHDFTHWPRGTCKISLIEGSAKLFRTGMHQIVPANAWRLKPSRRICCKIVWSIWSNMYWDNLILGANIAQYWDTDDIDNTVNDDVRYMYWDISNISAKFVLGASLLHSVLPGCWKPGAGYGKVIVHRNGGRTCLW